MKREGTYDPGVRRDEIPYEQLREPREQGGDEECIDGSDAVGDESDGHPPCGRTEVEQHEGKSRELETAGQSRGARTSRVAH